MKVSAFTFIKNGEILGYPFLQSIQSVLPIVEEFVINIGESEDDTLALINSISSPKIRIIYSNDVNDSYIKNDIKIVSLIAVELYNKIKSLFI